MKRIAIFAAVASLALPLSLTAVSLAQDEGRPGCEHGRHGPGGPEGHGRHGGPRERLERMAERLQLTPAQRTQAEQIFRDVHERMRAQHQSRRERPSREERHAAFDAVRTEVETRIDAILTPAQRATFAQMKAEHEQRRREHRERREQEQQPEGI